MHPVADGRRSRPALGGTSDVIRRRADAALHVCERERRSEDRGVVLVHDPAVVHRPASDHRHRRTSMPRKHCSIPGGSTRSSPTATSTASTPTDSTAATGSSNRSSPNSRPAPSRAAANAAWMGKARMVTIRRTNHPTPARLAALGVRRRTRSSRPRMLCGQPRRRESRGNGPATQGERGARPISPGRAPRFALSRGIDDELPMNHGTTPDTPHQATEDMLHVRSPGGAVPQSGRSRSASSSAIVRCTFHGRTPIMAAAAREPAGRSRRPRPTRWEHRVQAGRRGRSGT